MTWRIILKFGLALISLGACSAVFCQTPNRPEPTSGVGGPGLRGKTDYEAKCATCHGLDGLGGEHAPDIVRRRDAKALTDEELLDLIHDGIPEAGMPEFPSLGEEDAHALVAYIRSLQGSSAGNAVPGDPARGRELFVGKAGCSACHQIAGPGQFVAGDLSGFARDHSGDAIRDAILRPAAEPPETVTVVARDGRKFSGMIRNEDNASLQLQNADGQFYLLMKSSIVSVQRKAGNPMPLDYGQRLSSSQLNDLISYIQREAGPSEPSSSPSAESHAQD